MGGMLNSADLGRMIRNFRQNAGLSQERLAEKIGVTFQQIQKYESGYTTLNIIRLLMVFIKNSFRFFGAGGLPAL